jgi:hypothetical protein
MSKPAVLIRKSTGEILKHAPYPNVDMTPVVGLDPDLEWLLKHEPFPSPDYDSRIFELKVTNEVSEDTHPDHPEIKTYKRTYATVKRPDEDIIRQIENAEEAANRQLMTYRTDEKLFMLAIGILTRKNEGIQPSPSEQEILNKVMAFDEKFWKNNANKELKIQQVVDGIEPEIDEGWETGENAGA